ncbi:MaoC family dehydratase [Prauserella flavalba]|uniref:Protein dehydratase n=1 Tax=Prauserella flavalba TaxID=1477506 RepID=A0A318LRC4_9PSEU|nr:MaoC/PaaZ C-terminal domain-containing protein [Prauserella flavalba]PXY35954.1 protein dehydratase [Prauserella flavalba]
MTAPGDELPAYEVGPVSAEKMKTMSALMRDANPIHFDPAAVRALGLGDRVVNQGPLNQSYVVTMLTRWAGGADRVRALRLRFLGNVFAGDRLVAGGTVTAVRGDGSGRVADCDVWLRVSGGDPVLSGTATVLLGE